MELSGRSVFITGGAQGIGRAVTEALLAKGAKVNCPSGYVLHLPLCLSASGPVDLSVRLWASLSACGPLCLSASGPVGFSVCRPLSLWASLSVGLCACGPLCLSACGPLCLWASGPLCSCGGPQAQGWTLPLGRTHRCEMLLSLMDTSEARMTASGFVCLDLSLVALIDFRTQSCDYNIYDEMLRKSTVTFNFCLCHRCRYLSSQLRCDNNAANAAACSSLVSAIHSRLSVSPCRNVWHSSMTDAGDVLML